MEKFSDTNDNKPVAVLNVLSGFTDFVLTGKKFPTFRATVVPSPSALRIRSREILPGPLD
jgi:hypothetical protein